MRYINWQPKRIDIELANGEKHTIDAGHNAKVTIIIKGPFIDLKYENVINLEIEGTFEA